MKQPKIVTDQDHLLTFQLICEKEWKEPEKYSDEWPSSRWKLEEKVLDQCTTRDNIWRSWLALASVNQLNIETACHLITILVNTIPFLAAPKTLRQLNLERENDSLQAASERFRVYSKKQKEVKKTTSPEKHDLRTYLSSTKGRSEVLKVFSPYFEEASSGLKEERQKDWLLNSRLPDLCYGLALSTIPIVASTDYQLAAKLLATVDEGRERVIEKLAPFLRSANLIDDQNSLAALSALLNVDVGKDDQIVEWIEFALLLPPEKRGGWLSLLEANMKPANKIEKFPRNLFESILLSKRKATPHHIWFAINSILSGADSNDIADGISIINEVDVERSFDPIETRPGFSHETALMLIDSIGIDSLIDDGLDYGLINLWDYGGYLKGFEALARKVKWNTLSAANSNSLLKYFAFVVDHSDKPTPYQQKKWELILSFSDNILEALYKCPKEYQGKFISNLWRISNFWRTLFSLDEFFYDSLKLSLRFCKEPFLKKSSGILPMIDLLRTKDLVLRQVVIEMEEQILLKMDKHCDRYDIAWYVSRGVERLTEYNYDYSLASFKLAPEQFCKAARGIGFLSKVKAVNVLQKFDLFRSSLSRAHSPEQVLKTVERLPKANVTSPFTKRFREHLKGGKKLNEVQCKRDRTIMFKRLPAYEMGSVANMALEEITHGISGVAEDDNLRHAIEMLETSEYNQRAFKNFLKQYANGEKDYLHKHPTNRNWLSKRKSLDTRLWVDGIALSKSIPPIGKVTIQVENDPLEALRMGTYVGSCLSLGSNFSDSAMAAVLDINKQILYARDENGKVVGRQLVAIDQKERLVPFSVYPDSVSKELKLLFSEYCREWANEIKAPIYNGANKEDKYEIDTLMTQYWWDDHAWKLKRAK